MSQQLFLADFEVGNPSDFLRHDYVEVDLARLNVPSTVADDSLRLFYLPVDGKPTPVTFQIDHPFGRGSPYRGGRVMTFFSRDTPPGPEDYRIGSAKYRLVQAATSKPSPVGESPLRIEHYPVAGKPEKNWAPGQVLEGVKLINGRPSHTGLEVYFSLIPWPGVAAPTNYCGAATSVHHYRLGRYYQDSGNILSPLLFSARPFVRWGQLTRLDFYPLPWEPRFYHRHDLLGVGLRYSLAWSNAGPCRATVTLASGPFSLAFTTNPADPSPDLHLTCRLYRVISLFPWREWYSEQLLVRVEEHPSVSLAFRAHYLSDVDSGNRPPQLARFEDIPDYFAVWRRWADNIPMHLGYGFASDSHIRSLKPAGPEITWRLQLGHEHRNVHYFLYEPHHNFDPFHTIGHEGWYQGVFKRLEVIPLGRYLR